MKLLQCSDACRATRATARRDHLVTVARRLFADGGFHATGVAQIARASGIRVGQIYRDFADKEAIVAAIVETDLNRFLGEAALDAAIASGDARAIRDWIRGFVRCEGPSEGRRLMPEIVAEAVRNARIAAISHAAGARVRAAIGRALAALAPGEELAGARARIVDIVLVFGAGLMHRRVTDPTLDEDRTVATMLGVIDRELDLLVDPPAAG